MYVWIQPVQHYNTQKRAQHTPVQTIERWLPLLQSAHYTHRAQRLGPATPRIKRKRENVELKDKQVTEKLEEITEGKEKIKEEELGKKVKDSVQKWRLQR